MKIIKMFEELGFYQEECRKECSNKTDKAKCVFCGTGYFIHFRGKATSFKIYHAPLRVNSCYFLKEEMPFIVKHIDKFEYIDQYFPPWGREYVYEIMVPDLLEILEAEKK